MDICERNEPSMSEEEILQNEKGMLLREAALAYRTEADSYTTENEDEGWLQFREQCRRQMQRPLENRIKYGFCKMYKPVLDDAPWRVFKTMAEYRKWCEENLPDYLGFKRTLK